MTFGAGDGVETPADIAVDGGGSPGRPVFDPHAAARPPSAAVPANDRNALLLRCCIPSSPPTCWEGLLAPHQIPSRNPSQADNSPEIYRSEV
ncbi:hypothetical protein GCM10027360_37780 [Amycolatopsis echigonensis]